MKILAIMGARKNGNTSEVVRYFEGRFKEKAQGKDEVDFDYLYLSDYDLDFCTGCHNCIFTGESKCPHYETVKQIEDRIMNSDALILASPGYMFTVTGIMKNFLDHVAYNCHRPKYFGKRAFLIGCCTKWLEKGVLSPMETWANAAGFQIGGKLCVDMLPLPFSERELEKRRKKISDAASHLYEKMQDKVEFRPDFGGTLMFRALRTLARIAPRIMQADFSYFSERKAYDPETKWYVPARISLINRWLATFAERKMRKEIVKMIDSDKLKGVSAGFRNKL